MGKEWRATSQSEAKSNFDEEEEQRTAPRRRENMRKAPRFKRTHSGVTSSNSLNESETRHHRHRRRRRRRRRRGNDN